MSDVPNPSFAPESPDEEATPLAHRPDADAAPAEAPELLAAGPIPELLADPGEADAADSESDAAIAPETLVAAGSAAAVMAAANASNGDSDHAEIGADAAPTRPPVPEPPSPPEDVPLPDLPEPLDEAQAPQADTAPESLPEPEPVAPEEETAIPAPPPAETPAPAPHFQAGHCPRCGESSFSKGTVITYGGDFRPAFFKPAALSLRRLRNLLRPFRSLIEVEAQVCRHCGLVTLQVDVDALRRIEQKHGRS
ncbi:MAG: hypothetical protein Kow0077_14090 [Anaerolineae bacterium]